MDILCETYKDEQMQRHCESSQTVIGEDADVAVPPNDSHPPLDTQKLETFVMLKRPRTCVGDPLCGSFVVTDCDELAVLKRTDDGDEGETTFSISENPPKTLLDKDEAAPELLRPTSPVFKKFSVSSTSSFNSLSPPVRAKCSDVMSTPSPMKLPSSQSPARLPPPQSASLFINFGDDIGENDVVTLDDTTSEISKVDFSNHYFLQL
jgi:hypothetical protein